MPGRATSLASVGLLLGLSVLVGALGNQAAPGSTLPLGSSAIGHSAIGHSTAHSGTRRRDPRSPDTTETTLGPIETQSFRCPPPTGSVGAQKGTRVLVSGQQGPAVTATTFCRGSAWFVSEHVSERTSDRTTVVARPFRVPDDPPIPASVTVEQFVPLRTGTLPAVLVEREQFATASLYELFTLVGHNVEPMLLSPGGSPVLLLRASSELQGAGFRCYDAPSGTVIRQYEWYVVNPTTLETTADGQVLGDPAVFFQTTVYTVSSADTFTAATLTTATRGYQSAEKLSDSSC